MIKYYFTIIFLFSLGFGIAQDPAFSQFYIQRMYLNPALTGTDRGLAASFGYRHSWRSIDKGFKTIMATAEIRNDCAFKNGAIGLGLLVASTKEGLAGYQRNDVGFGFNLMLGNEIWGGNLGITTRWRQESVNTSGFVFSDQLDPIRPDISPSTFAYPLMNQRSLMDVDAGFLIRFDTKNIRPKAKVYPKILLGGSMNNLVSFWKGNHNSFIDTGTSGNVPRLSLHGSMAFKVAKNDGDYNTIHPVVVARVESQGVNPMAFKKNLVLSTFGSYLMFNKFYLGGMYQHRSLIPSNLTHVRSWILAVGLFLPKDKKSGNEIQQGILGLSWDLNSTDRALGTSTGNAFELSLRMRFANNGCWGISKAKTVAEKRNVKTRIPDCEDFLK